MKDLTPFFPHYDPDWDPSEYNLEETATRHELGHQFSLTYGHGDPYSGHCNNQSCVMSVYAESDPLNPYFNFCSACKAEMATNKP